MVHFDPMAAGILFASAIVGHVAGKPYRHGKGAVARYSNRLVGGSSMLRCLLSIVPAKLWYMASVLIMLIALALGIYTCCLIQHFFAAGCKWSVFATPRVEGWLVAAVPLAAWFTATWRAGWECHGWVVVAAILLAAIVTFFPGPAVVGAVVSATYVVAGRLGGWLVRQSRARGLRRNRGRLIVIDGGREVA